MSARQLPAALVLGLLASLAAHAAAFGGSHEEGGAYHALVQTLAFAGGLFGLLAATVAAFAKAGHCAQGSIVAARLASFVPRARLVAASGLGWFALIESVEPAHAGGSLLVILCAMIAASLVVRLLALGALRLLGAFAFAIAKLHYSERRPSHPARFFSNRPRVRALLLARRHVTRPPPRVHLAPA